MIVFDNNEINLFEGNEVVLYPQIVSLNGEAFSGNETFSLLWRIDKRDVVDVKVNVFVKFTNQLFYV